MKHNHDFTRTRLPEDILEGLEQNQKKIPSKYFYDKKGSQLFKQITRQPEYYLTRTEISIIESNIEGIAAQIGDQVLLMELGSGNSRKTRLLLDNLTAPAAYIPVDISEEYLLDTARKLRNEYPGLVIKPLCTDYTDPFNIPVLPVDYSRISVFFPGSTIGNFTPGEAREFLEILDGVLDHGDGLLIGVDLKKDPEILNAAYNDEEGITAAFNKNILHRLNRDFNTDFEVECYSHKAFYNEEKGRVEMHLVSKTDQVIHAGQHEFELKRGDTIHTENSYKYSLEEFRDLVSDLYSRDAVWTDANNWFSLHYLLKE